MHPHFDPVPFVFVALAWSGFQAYVGGIAGGFICDSARGNEWGVAQRKTRFVAYVLAHGSFYFLCSVSGFMACWVLSRLAVEVNDWSKVEGGTGAVMIALGSIMIAGISGALPRILHLGGKP